MTEETAKAEPGAAFNYDAAWGARLKLVQDWVGAGVRDSHHLLAALHRQERSHEIWVDSRGDAVWRPRAAAADDSPTWPGGAPLMRPTSLKGRPLEVPLYAKFSIGALMADLARYYGPFDAVVELGCGHGRNLFELFDELYDQDDLAYVGGELADTGLELCRVIARHHRAPQRFTFARFDHTRPEMSLVPPATQRLLILTVHSIEQVRRLPLDYFHILSAAAPKVVGVHVEPFGFQVDAGFGPATRAQAQFFAERRWNTNFVHALRRAETDGAVAVEARELECFLPVDPANPSSLAVWRKA